MQRMNIVAMHCGENGDVNLIPTARTVSGVKNQDECTHADQQGGDGSAILQVDHGQQIRQVTLSGS